MGLGDDPREAAIGFPVQGTVGHTDEMAHLHADTLEEGRHRQGQGLVGGAIIDS